MEYLHFYTPAPLNTYRQWLIDKGMEVYSPDHFILVRDFDPVISIEVRLDNLRRNLHAAIDVKCAKYLAGIRTTYINLDQ